MEEIYGSRIDWDGNVISKKTSTNNEVSNLELKFNHINKITKEIIIDKIKI